ncbi:MAG TPA: RNA polymerase sigma factor, partial [Planctomycetota bacterium]|nr:RNA polymerase sigma factor [Planctomycetota bacterium]
MKRPAASDRLDDLLAHRAWVRRVARALVLDESRADDLEQEAWLRAMRAPEVRSPRAWLGTVLRNAASNLRLAERRRGARESAAPPPTDGDSPPELLERAEAVEQVARAVRTLEEPYRAAILLRYFEELPPPAIAARLGAPLETVRTRLRRGLVLLRERLDREHRGDRRRWALLLLPLARRPEPAAA